MEVGRSYEVVLRSGRKVRGVLRSADLSQGCLLNRDGRHRIWLGGDGYEWFIRPDLVVEVRELELAKR
jgi:hypothetical protein